MAGQVQVQPLEEDALVVAGLRNTAGADLVTIACGKHNVDDAQFTQFDQDPTQAPTTRRAVECYVYHVAAFAKHFGRSL